MMRLLRLAAFAAAGLAIVAVLWWFWREVVEPAAPAPRDAEGPLAARISRGAYLARAGNCMLCHTVRGGEPYAGGRPIETPFGTVYSSNLTPDEKTGLGRWTSVDFWRAMHEGRSMDGRLLVPAFPYANFTLVTQEDADDLWAFLRSLPPVARANEPHALRWPYDSQLALAAWRGLYFKPDHFQRDPARGAVWNRGAYLVRGLGHCNACHTSRNLLGAADPQDLAGGAMPMKNWYAPSLLRKDEASVAHWEVADIVQLLRRGTAPGASVSGPMAEVVLHGTQYLTDQDLRAMATYLKNLPQDEGSVRRLAADVATPSAAGERLYATHCASCHGEAGQGVAGAYPALAGNRAVLMAYTANIVQIVLLGGFAPATNSNPKPFGMPPFQLLLDDRQVAELLTFVRGAWGNQAGRVSELDVRRYRGNTTR